MNRRTHPVEMIAAWLLALVWLAPLAYAFWAALHPAAYATSFSLSAPWTLENFARAWSQAPFGRYYLNTIVLVCLVLAGQLVLSTLAAYAFARFKFRGSGIAFALVLLQLMIMPDVLIVENYRAISAIGLLDTIPAIALPYLASAFAIFLLRQTFKSIPQELVDAARVEGAGPLQVLWRVYIPLARPTYIAFGLVSVSYHWNNFLWPLIVTNSVGSRPLTVGIGRLRRAGDWRRLVDHFGRDRHDDGAAADCLFAVPAAVRAVFHAGGNSLMRLVTWNIQCGKGCDGVVDLARIVAAAKWLADADIFCFQEVSDGFEALDGGADQSAQLAALLPHHRPVFRSAVETIDSGGQVAPFRQHDAVAFAGAAGCRSPAAVAAGRRMRAACGVWRWKSRFRPVRSDPDRQHAP